MCDCQLLVITFIEEHFFVYHFYIKNFTNEYLIINVKIFYFFQNLCIYVSSPIFLCCFFFIHDDYTLLYLFSKLWNFIQLNLWTWFIKVFTLTNITLIIYYSCDYDVIIEVFMIIMVGLVCFNIKVFSDICR